MAEFDTSGAVEPPASVKFEWPRHMRPRALTWQDLDAFTQGYVAAIFASALERDLESHRWRLNLGFADLAPETLVAIMRDCEDYMQAPDAWREDGREFWEARANGLLQAFPSLCVRLGDDGRIYLDKES